MRGNESTKKKPHKRLKYTEEQVKLLQSVYLINPMPTLEQRQQLAKALDRSPRSIQIWFQNKRAKEKKESTLPMISNQVSPISGTATPQTPEDDDMDDSQEYEDQMLPLNNPPQHYPLQQVEENHHPTMENDCNDIQNIGNNLAQKFFENGRYLGMMSPMMDAPAPMYRPQQMPLLPPIITNKESPLSMSAGYCSSVTSVASPEEQNDMNFMAAHATPMHNMLPPQPQVHSMIPKPIPQLNVGTNFGIYGYVINELVIDGFSYKNCSQMEPNAKSLYMFQGNHEDMFGASSPSSSTANMHSENCSFMDFGIDTREREVFYILACPIRGTNGTKLHYKRISFDYQDILKIYFHVSEKEGVLLLKQCRPPRAYEYEGDAIENPLSPANAAEFLNCQNWSQINPEKSFMQCAIHELHCPSNSLVKIINSFRNLHDRFKNLFVNNVNELLPSGFYTSP